MNKIEFEKARPIPMDKARYMRQTAFTTIRYLIDVIVELVTNSDDSYKRLEQEGIEVEGKIIIRVRRLKYNKCEKLEVIDFAEGMDKDKLEKALTFAGATSGFEKGRTVRGLLGRGLKEAIIALGKAEIYTIKDDKLCIANVWWDEKEGLMYEPLERPYPPTKEERKEIGVIEGNGTAVRITVTNEKINCPDYKTFCPQIINHYALRDINSASNRKVTLDFQSPEKGGLKYIGKPISYEPPKGKRIIEQSIKLPDYGDNAEIRVYESHEELESPYNNPFARAGLLIKTSGAILDNQLFKYQSEKAGCFFFGEVIWEGLAERLRKEDWGVITPDRTGVNWHHQYCEVLRNEIEKILEPLIGNKKKQIEIKAIAPPSEKIEKLNKDVCSLLNRLAEKHMAELPSGDELSGGEETKIKTLTIKPPHANIEINKERYFSVYAPANILNPSPGYYQAEVKSNNLHIQVLDPKVKLDVHSKYSDIYYGRFRVIGRLDKEEATITCKLGNYIAIATARVAPPGKIGKRKEPKGGFFHDIKPESEENPAQRARYDKNAGIIRIYVNFPGVKRYFEDNLNFKSDESKPMYAELVGEAFCEFVARYDVDQGRPPAMGDPINAFTIAMDNSQKKYLHLIHEAVFKHKL
ncbi:MAG: hypothetical protein COT13_02925 [Chloroflexi bacterium CG08_land_8_20_14_0_20_45_12]|nr:MAG: hypothetical protein COT13_02925 [Chloroflexi bacterium CG08_land_8_20_14_0_20_45_12]